MWYVVCSRLRPERPAFFFDKKTQRHEKGLIFSQEKAQKAQKGQKNDQKSAFFGHPFSY